MIFRAGKAAAILLIAAAILTWSISALAPHANRPAPSANRPPVRLNLIPDYENNILGFEGSAPVRPGSDVLDLNGLPLQPNGQWMDPGKTTWYFMGTVKGGEIVPTDNGYSALFEPVVLQPGGRLELSLPFVALDPSQVRLQPPPPDENGGQESISPFSHEAGPAGKRIDSFYIPFKHIQKTIHLTLTPLAGEALAGNPHGLRLSGKVQFSSLTFYGAFRDYCPDPVSAPGHLDFRRAHLLNVLDFSPFSGISTLSPSYQYQSTRVALRTELASCRYDTANRTASVEAAFFGKVFPFQTGRQELPQTLKNYRYPDGNFGYDLDPEQEGLEAYKIGLGKIVLGPGDTLTVTVPHTHVLVERVSPAPHDLLISTAGRSQQLISLVYQGPASFQLNVPYLPEPQLYLYQFPAVLRPGLTWMRGLFGPFFPFSEASFTWIALVLGLLGIVFSRWKWGPEWLASFGWLLILLSLYYGVRGSLGLLCAALVSYASQIRYSDFSVQNRAGMVRRLAGILGGLLLLSLGIYLDRRGEVLFSQLSEHELSPLTPLFLLLLVPALLFALYGWSGSKAFTRSDLPFLMLFLVVPALYDALDKSLIALLVLLAAGLYLLRPTAPDEGASARRRERQYAVGLQKRWNLVFRNKTVMLAIVVMMIFAVANDLPRIFSNPIQVDFPPLLAFLLIPLLVFVSVFLTLSSIAFLFILVYPYLPFPQGYLKAAVFALIMFLVFLMGIGTDDRLIEFLPNLLVGRVIYYLSMPVLIGVSIDIHEFMERENRQSSGQGKEKRQLTFRAAAGLYFKELQGFVGTLTGIGSVAAPALYGFVSNQPVIVTYFSLLQKLVIL